MVNKSSFTNTSYLRCNKWLFMSFLIAQNIPWIPVK